MVNRAAACIKLNRLVFYWCAGLGPRKIKGLFVKNVYFLILELESAIVAWFEESLTTFSGYFRRNRDRNLKKV